MSAFTGPIFLTLHLDVLNSSKPGMAPSLSQEQIYMVGQRQLAEATEELLQRITTELMLSRTGPRFITGDSTLPVRIHQALLSGKPQGWVEIQSWVLDCLGRVPIPTSKHTIFLDHLFVSLGQLQ